MLIIYEFYTKAPVVYSFSILFLWFNGLKTELIVLRLSETQFGNSIAEVRIQQKNVGFLHCWRFGFGMIHFETVLANHSESVFDPKTLSFKM
jgi:hypothetical protein